MKDGKQRRRMVPHPTPVRDHPRFRPGRFPGTGRQTLAHRHGSRSAGSLTIAAPRGVKGALDGVREFHPPGERQAVTGAVADDAGDWVGLEIEDDGKPGMIRWHGENDAALP
jgi:hypothetical protein